MERLAGYLPGAAQRPPDDRHLVNAPVVFTRREPREPFCVPSPHRHVRNPYGISTSRTDAQYRIDGRPRTFHYSETWLGYSILGLRLILAYVFLSSVLEKFADGGWINIRGIQRRGILGPWCR